MKKRGLSNLIIAIIIGVFIFVLIVLYSLFKWFWGPTFHGNDYIPEFPEDNYTDDLTQYPDYPLPGQPSSSREFQRSDKLSTISFSRIIDLNENGIETNIEINILLSGYVREVPTSISSEPLDTAREYVFDEDRVEWDIYLKEYDNDNPDCIYTYIIEEAGNGRLADLEDPSVIEGWREVNLNYGDYGSETGTPELFTGGKLLIPFEEVEEIEVHDPSPNVGAICSGYTESVTLRENKIAELRFPLILYNVNINETVFEGSRNLEELTWEDPTGNSMLSGTHSIIAIPTVIFEGDPVTWDVNWEINLP